MGKAIKNEASPVGTTGHRYNPHVTDKPPHRIRLDELVQRRTGYSRTKAQGLIHTGMVKSADGKPLTKPGHSVPDDLEFTIEEAPKFVSRGGSKLEAALDAYALNVTDKIAIDVGASTGGFTDCLLQRGAAKVYAVDVGYGQLDWKLRQDPRVVVLERTNIRNVTPEQIAERPSFFTVDCSFISLKLVLPPLTPLLARPAEGVVLIKPQFEAGRDQVGKGGVVRDPEIHTQVVENVRETAQTLGYTVANVMLSPLEGPAGNKEFLAHLKLNA